MARKPPLRPLELPDRPDLDAPQPRRGDLRRHLDRVVQVPGLDEIEPAELLLGLGEGAVGGGHLAVPDPHGRGGLGLPPRLAAPAVAAPSASVRDSRIIAPTRSLLD